MPIEFFMMPDEQRKWLRQNFSGDDIWCWIRMRGTDSRLVSGAKIFETVGSLKFDNDSLMELDFGGRSIESPIFRQTPFFTELEFARSLAVQFLPSLILKETALFQGQLAISGKQWYEYFGVQAEPVVRWYHQLARSLKKTFAKENILTCTIEDGRVFTYRDVHLSPGAVEWRNRGNELRTSTNKFIKYDVVPRTKRGKG